MAISSSSVSPSLLHRFLIAPSLLHPPQNSAFTPNHYHSFCNAIPLRHHRHSFYLAPLCKQQKQKSQKNTSLPLSPPPSTREEAISQARNAIALVLEKSLRSSDGPSPVRRRKLQKPSRFQVELPLLEESDSAQASLLLDLISSLSLGKTGNLLPSCTVFCNGNVIEMLNSTRNPNLALGESDDPRTFQNPKFQFCDIASGMIDLQETQVVVIFSPNLSHVAAAENIVKASDLRPVLVINPDWYSEKEENVSKSASFVESFEVIYSYLPLVIQGFFSKTEGAVVKQYVENGGSPSSASSSSPWFIYVNEGDNMKCVSRLAKRPSSEDLENALYNAVAANSPLTKSVKFLKGLLGDR